MPFTHFSKLLAHETRHETNQKTRPCYSVDRAVDDTENSTREETKWTNKHQSAVGIVGCGYQGGILAQAIGRTKALQVTACADPDQTAAAQVAKLAGNVAVYGSIEALLTRRRWMP